MSVNMTLGLMIAIALFIVIDLWPDLRRARYRRLRQIDLEILWPACKDQAETLHDARIAFALHAMNDKAWLALGEEEVIKRVRELN